ncbi:Uu.00g106650.m01.CDS01 [Anthostomella pinea]|uniref:Uu.00g106650.m01.CDS01 n=1 Tax=Anthostomella pinea TaxID=933095 RepID=A0AAI8VE71_9PEZI|nr:Uu.00g106650.m01.CDS01 [Anthostomella pinea]
MAEAIATLSLASSCLQVIDFGAKVASTAVKLRRGQTDEGIKRLAEGCKGLIEELLLKLNKLAGIDSSRTTGAARLAFKWKWNEDEIRAIERRVAEFRSQLTVSLLISLR